MSSGMNREQAEEYAKTMTHKQAIGNIRTGKGIKYRKATMIKLHELAEIADKLVLCKDCRHRVHDDSRDYYYCEMFYGQGDVSDENFCQWGERKEP